MVWNIKYPVMACCWTKSVLHNPQRKTRHNFTSWFSSIYVDVCLSRVKSEMKRNNQVLLCKIDLTMRGMCGDYIPLDPCNYVELLYYASPFIQYETVITLHSMQNHKLVISPHSHSLYHCTIYITVKDILIKKRGVHIR